MEYKQTVSFEEAKKIVEEVACGFLEQYRKSDEIPILSEEFMEAECCWFFFRNKKIKGSLEQSLAWDRAYTVSKKGSFASIGDFSDEPEKLKEYLQIMSDHFKKKNE